MAAALDRPDSRVVQRECLASYKHCPTLKSVITRTHNKVTLSRNGFYYSGKDNIVKCYYCDVGIEKVEDMKRHGKVCVGTKKEQKSRPTDIDINIYITLLKIDRIWIDRLFITVSPCIQKRKYCIFIILTCHSYRVMRD